MRSHVANSNSEHKSALLFYLTLKKAINRTVPFVLNHKEATFMALWSRDNACKCGFHVSRITLFAGRPWSPVVWTQRCLTWSRYLEQRPSSVPSVGKVRSLILIGFYAKTLVLRWRSVEILPTLNANAVIELNWRMIKRTFLSWHQDICNVLFLVTTIVIDIRYKGVQQMCISWSGIDIFLIHSKLSTRHW